MYDEWLTTQGVYQRQTFGHNFAKMPTNEILTYVDEMLKAAAIEILSEAYNEFSWKSWAKNQFLNRDALVGEVIDAEFFLANVLVALGVSDEEHTTKYRRKMEINTARQERGYDTSAAGEKCPSCKRGLDDTAVTCTTDRCSEE